MKILKGIIEYFKRLWQFDKLVWTHREEINKHMKRHHGSVGLLFNDRLFCAGCRKEIKSE